MVIDLQWTSDLQNDTVTHDGDPVRHGHGLFLIVSYIDKGDAQLLLKALELDLHLFAQLQVKGSERLVQEKNAGVVNQRACNGYTLFLTTGKRIRLALFIAGHLHQRKHLLDLSPNFLFWHFSD